MVSCSQKDWDRALPRVRRQCLEFEALKVELKLKSKLRTKVEA